MTTIKKRLLVAAGILVGVVVITGFLPISLSEGFVNKYGDAMDWRSRFLAGRHGTDCGRVKIGQDPATATKCALEAHAAGRSFRVRYDIQGFDSPVAGGIVGTPDGRLLAVSFDGDPGGGGRTSLWGQRAGVKSCPEPSTLYVNPKGRLNCFQKELSQPAGITAPNMEPY